VRKRIDGIFAPAWKTFEGINGVTLMWIDNGITFVRHIEYPKFSQLKNKDRL
jgi:hypothetical protein